MADETTNPEATMLCGAGLFPWWLILVWGILTLIIGVLLLTTPALTTELLIVFLGAYWLVGGIFSLGSLVVDRTNMGLKILIAVINIIAGALIMIYPFFSTIFILSFFVIFIGFYACFIGAVHLYQAFKGKDAGNAVLGIISVVFGLLLLVNPFLTAALLPFIAGGFCIVSGLSGIIASFMAKKMQPAAAS